MKTTMKMISAGVATAAVMAGCASTAENMRAQGYGPYYSQGYGDGCTSGKKAGGSMFDQFKKNPDLYMSNGKYKMGWDDGYRECRSEEIQLMKSIDDATRDQAIRDLKNK